MELPNPACAPGARPIGEQSGAPETSLDVSGGRFVRDLSVQSLRTKRLRLKDSHYCLTRSVLLTKGIGKSLWVYIGVACRRLSMSQDVCKKGLFAEACRTEACCKKNDPVPNPTVWPRVAERRTPAKMP